MIKTRIAVILVFISAAIFYCSATVPAGDNKEATRLLSRLIQIKSITGNEGEAGRFLESYCREKGLYTTIFTNADSAYNFAASLYPLEKKKPNIVLYCHLDIVSEGDTAAWQYPPFSGKVADDTIWGRGAIDCKGLAVMELMAILSYVDSAAKNDLPFNVTLLCVSGEEKSGQNGSEIVTEKFLAELNATVIFGEGGSGMTRVVSSNPGKVIFGISVAEKKALWLRLQAKSNTNGHGAVPPAWYANQRMVIALTALLNHKNPIKFSDLTRNMFKELGKLEGGIKGFFTRHISCKIIRPLVKSNFSKNPYAATLVHDTYVVTNMGNPAGPVNQVAGNAYVTLDCRLLPQTDTAVFMRMIRKTAGPDIEVSVISESPQAAPSEITGYFEKMALTLGEIYPGSKTVPILFPATTDNNYYRQRNIPVYGIVPVVFSARLMDSVHNVDERIAVTDLEKGTAVFKKFIDRVLLK